MADFPGHPKFRRIRHSMDELIPLSEYCQNAHITRASGMNRIGKERIWGYKICGRWYVPADSRLTIDS